MRPKFKILWIVGVMVAAALAVMIPSVLAAATAQGVALSAWADCSSNADLDITLTTSGATREYGLVTNDSGQTLGEFEQATGLSNFSGTFVGYGMPISAPQPVGTLIGSYAYVGETPPSAADTAEFFVLYECTGSGVKVLSTCYGPYGQCPQTAKAATTPGCDVLVDIPATAVGGAFVSDAQIYWEPGEVTEHTFKAGDTVRVIGKDASGMYYQVLYVCDFLWVKADTLGPNYDPPWYGAPLPTAVVD